MTAARSALDRNRLWARLAGGLVTSFEVFPEVTSTNAELARAAGRDGPSTGGRVVPGADSATGRVLVAEWQNAGRGRFDRVWTSPPRAGLTFSMLLRPDDVPVARWSWLPLLAGLALRAAVLDLLGAAGAAVWLKWPNDLVLGPDRAKSAGILAEVHGDAVILGMGVNVHNTVSELPGPFATSLDLAFPGAGIDRGDLLVAVVEAFAGRYARWREHGGDAGASDLRAEYERVCDTIGRAVEIDQNGVARAGTATGVDAGGALLVTTADGVRAISAGDVTHVRRR